MILVDTPVWVQALRVAGSREHRELDHLLASGDVAVVGPVIAEVIQGARDVGQMDRLRRTMGALPYVADTKETWMAAAALSFRLRQSGQTIGVVDALIAALALEGGHSVYTRDTHFERIPGLALHEAAVE